MTLWVSVALCTLDGDRYLKPQLDSILSQTRSPVELIVCDDGSADSTIGLLADFSRNSSFPVRIVRNPVRLGVTRNFAKAVSLCGGDVIALADQDDLWVPTKLSTLAAILERTPDALAAFSDAEVVDPYLRSHGYTMWQQTGFSAPRQRLIQADRPWDVLFKDPVVTGATLMFRRELLPLVLPIPEGWVHDAWIAQIAASQGRLVAVEEPLVLYRQHAANVIGGRKLTLRAQVTRARALGRAGLVDREIGRYSALRDRLVTFSPTARRDVMLAMCDAKLEHLERRRRLPARRVSRVPSVFLEWISGNYRRFAKDWRNIAADLLME